MTWSDRRLDPPERAPLRACPGQVPLDRDAAGAGPADRDLQRHHDRARLAGRGDVDVRRGDRAMKMLDAQRVADLCLTDVDLEAGGARPSGVTGWHLDGSGHGA